MKHQKKGRKFGRVKKQRESLRRIMLGNLILREKMKTTEAKAKEIKGEVDILVNKAKEGMNEGKKVVVTRYLRNRVPVIAAEKLQESHFLEKFTGRGSGYTRIIKLNPRQSDGARMAVIEFVK